MSYSSATLFFTPSPPPFNVQTFKVIYFVSKCALKDCPAATSAHKCESLQLMVMWNSNVLSSTQILSTWPLLDTAVKAYIADALRCAL